MGSSIYNKPNTGIESTWFEIPFIFSYLFSLKSIQKNNPSIMNVLLGGQVGMLYFVIIDGLKFFHGWFIERYLNGGYENG